LKPSQNVSPARPAFCARRGSPVDALVVSFAEPAGNIITGDLEDIQALAAFTEGVNVIGI
jgi:hypothetical protein